MTMQHVLSEFPDYDGSDLPELAASLGNGWRLCAWHNDTMPYLAHVSDLDGRYRIWVDWIDPAKREYPEGKRFILENTLWNSSGDCEEVDVAIETDNWQEIADYVKLELEFA